VVLTNVYPTLHGEIAYVLVVEQDIARVVGTITIDETTERRFTRARISLNEIYFPFLELDGLLPYVGLQTGTLGKHVRQGM
jgi:hypothetical protein